MKDIAFACHECGKAIAFPGERRGHVETCPHCSNYVDVPFPSDPSLLSEMGVATESSPSTPLDSASRTTISLWAEVFAVLCLCYLPYFLHAVVAFWGNQQTASSFASDRLCWLVDSLQMSMPLLVIMALSRDRWSLFGIVRPRWIVDSMLACFVLFGNSAARHFVFSLLPASIWQASASLRVSTRLGIEGVPSHLFLLAACIMGAFAEELTMRGYLIPRLERLLGSTWMAVLITSVLFGSYHLYQGVGQAIMTTATGLVFAVSFCLCRRLWPLCAAHALHNFLLYL